MMRKFLRVSAIGLAAALAFLAIGRAQSNHSGVAKSDGKSAAFDPHDLTGIGIRRRSCSPREKSTRSIYGGHPNPLPPFTPAGEKQYLANAKFIAAGAVQDCDPFGVSAIFLRLAL